LLKNPEQTHAPKWSVGCDLYCDFFVGQSVMVVVELNRFAYEPLDVGSLS
jgi:hypothetical protein